MKRLNMRSGTLVPALLVSLWFGVAAAEDIPDELMPEFRADTDNPGHALSDAQKSLKLKALQARLSGKGPGGPVAEVAKGQFVELERLGEDTIWTVLGEFGDLKSPFGILQGGAQGPQRNQIPQPNRQVDNATIWAPDFSRSYFMNLLFSGAPGAVSMRNFYIEQSSNRYTVNGDVSDWVTVPFNEANYGANYCGGIVCARTWLFVRDSVNAWYKGQFQPEGRPAQINAYLGQFDVGTATTTTATATSTSRTAISITSRTFTRGKARRRAAARKGSNAIWSHRWYAFYTQIGINGPPFNKFGGVRIGESDYWVGDYTIEPENGGVGVFAHEFGHDLGLPDLYDTSGNVGGAENSTGFWTLYSSGSYGSSGPGDGIGTQSGPYERLRKDLPRLVEL